MYWKLTIETVNCEPANCLLRACFLLIREQNQHNHCKMENKTCASQKRKKYILKAPFWTAHDQIHKNRLPVSSELTSITNLLI
jgi:hypothetical protein